MHFPIASHMYYSFVRNDRVHVAAGAQHDGSWTKYRIHLESAGWRGWDATGKEWRQASRLQWKSLSPIHKRRNCGSLPDYGVAGLDITGRHEDYRHR